MGSVKRFILVIAIIFIGVSLCACAGRSANARIYVSLDNMPDTLDPQVASSDSELMIARNIYEGLTRQDENGDIVKAACKDYRFENLTYTFTLRDDIKWSNGKKIVADDFVFGIKRALLPETRAPFARLLFAIKGAPEVNAGRADAGTLGISAPDSKTVKITLSYDDEEFLRVLSMPVSMPCKEDFFYESTGKYGLERDYILSCGSYKVGKWNKTDFGIRLLKNDEYTGSFKPKNAAVYIAKDKEKSVVEKLNSGDADMALLSAKYLPKVDSGKIKLTSVQNICWVLSLGGDFSQNVRRALCMCTSSESYKKNLPAGFTAADSIYPGVLSKNTGTDVAFARVYDSVTARSLISAELKNFKNKKFPQTTLVYSQSEPMRTVITLIVGDWQQNLSTFINIKSEDKSLEGELKTHSLPLSVFPVKADSTLGEYLYKFGVDYKGDAVAAAKKAEGHYNLLPVAFEDTTVGYRDNLSGVNISATGGYVDFSFVVKK